MSATNETETPSEIQNGETFNEEMKDYAKSTMNELLGMFGYKEEITREAVEELQIRLLPEEDEDHMQPSGDDAEKSYESDGSSAKAVNIQGKPPAVVVEVEGCSSADSASALPVPNGKDLVEACTPPQPVFVVEGVPLPSVDKSGAVMAPHFLVNPPNIHGVYCVVANLPVVNSKGKTNMTFKFWNCIMCSEYFVEKPEVAFRVEHPHLFQSQPAWLYQAAVCQKCHQTLQSARQEPDTTACREDSSLSSSSSSSTVVTVPRQQNVEAPAMNSVLAGIKLEKCTETVADYKTTEHLTESNLLVVRSQPDAKVKSNVLQESHDYLFECFVCSKPVRKSSRQGRLRRSKFPTLFNSFPENVGVARVCFICCERLTRQRDRYVRAGISEEYRDYIAHIKIWTGQDVSSKFASLGVSKMSSDSTCFICEKFIPVAPNELVKTFQRSKYPSLFSLVPDQILRLSCCDACSRKLQKVKNRFDENNTKEEERDYWEYITSWRDKKGLEKHLYSS